MEHGIVQSSPRFSRRSRLLWAGGGIVFLTLCALCTEEGWLMRHLPISKQRATARETPHATKAAEREESDSFATVEDPPAPDPQLEAFLDKYGRTPANYAAIAIYGGGHGYGKYLRDVPDDPKALAYRLHFWDADTDEVLAGLEKIDPDNALIDLVRLQNIISVEGEMEVSAEQILRLLHEAGGRKECRLYEPELEAATFEMMRFQGRGYAESWMMSFHRGEGDGGEIQTNWISAVMNTIQAEADPAKRDAAARDAMRFLQCLEAADGAYSSRRDTTADFLQKALEERLGPEECTRLLGKDWEQEKKNRARAEAVKWWQLHIALEKAEPQVLVEMEKIYRQSGPRNAERYLLENVKS